jgi:tetratricopeptide (TPR) repeat protein
MHYKAALEAADRVAALDSSNADAVLLKAVSLVESGRLEESFDEVNAARGRIRPSPALAFAASYALTFAGYLDEARVAMEEALVLDPLFLTDEGWTPNVFFYLRDWERFLTHLPGREQPVHCLYRGLAELERGRRDAARQAVGGVFERYPQDVFARLSLALEALLHDRPREARTTILALSKHLETVGSTDGEVSFKHALLLTLAGDDAAALTELERAVAQGFVCIACIDGQPAFERVSSHSRYAALIDRARQRHAAFGKRFGLTPR